MISIIVEIAIPLNILPKMMGLMQNCKLLGLNKQIIWVLDLLNRLLKIKKLWHKIITYFNITYQVMLVRHRRANQRRKRRNRSRNLLLSHLTKWSRFWRSLIRKNKLNHFLHTRGFHRNQNQLDLSKNSSLLPTVMDLIFSYSEI